jgi:hypothetical protein
MEDTSGFYKFDGESWYFAPNFVWSKNYTLERDGNRESIDGWEWHDSEPLQYTLWRIQQENDNQ